MAVEVVICGDHLGQLHRTLCDLRQAGFDHIRTFGYPAGTTPPPPERIVPTVPTHVDKLSTRCADIPGHLRHGRLCVDVAGHQVRVDAELLDITPSEFVILTTLLAHRGIVLSRTQLLEALHGCAAHTPNTVEAHISALRRKFGAHDLQPIETVRAVGYVIRREAPPPPVQRGAR